MHTLEDVDLEAIFANDACCEVQHEITPCAVKVTHLIAYTCEDGSVLACVTAARVAADWMRMGDLCNRCERSLIDCWTIRPA